MMNRLLIIVLTAVAMGAIGCSRTTVPNAAIPAGRSPNVSPNDDGSTIPVNLAPTRFVINEEGDEFKTLLRGNNGGETILRGRSVQIGERFWKKLLAANAGGEISFTVYVRKDGAWTEFSPLRLTVSPDRIDPFIAYRLIEPGYEFYRRVTLNERSLETYREKAFFDNAVTDQKTCANCHSFQNHGVQNFLFHTRGKFGGTVLVRNGRAVKLDTKSPTLGLSAVYPSWHPTKPLVAFSTNKTKQVFHSTDPNRVDVLDLYSDLTLFDVEKKQFTSLGETRTDYETFPSWSSDGNALYYCSAHLELGSEIDTKPLEEIFRLMPHDKRFADYKYNILRRSFDADTRTFGPPETIIDAAAEGKSALHPRESPDGKFLVYAKADYGTFPIWHRESNLWLLNRTTGEKRPLDEINSPDAESWHTWDSSGRWMVFSSRRDDGSFTRLYFAHFNESGTFDKPFILPQKDPENNIDRMKSFNVPEFITAEIPLSAGAFGRIVRHADTESTSHVSPGNPQL